MSSCDPKCRDRRPMARAGLTVALTLAAVPAIPAPGDFLLGAGLEVDSEDSIAAAVLADVAVGESTWLSGSLSHSDFELPGGRTIDNLYADAGIEHFFDPVGVRLGAAYWGDDDLLESSDLRAAVYLRGNAGRLSLDAEHREFDFSLPGGDRLAPRTVGFDATGVGLSASVDVSPRVSLRANGMSYDYSREFRLGDTDRIRDLLTLTRLSVLSSLVDWSASAGIGFDAGQQSWQLDISRWAGVVDDSDNIGVTLGFITPMTDRTDIEISLGYDDSDLYGEITFLSVYVFFYGGGP